MLKKENTMNTSPFSNTPTITVLDNRGLTVRDIAYHRHPDTPDVTSGRITRHRYDARGFLMQSADPRLHETGLANFSYLTDLAGSVLRTVSVDAGTTVALNDAAGRPFIAVSNIRTAGDGTEDLSQAVTHTWQYEDAALPGRTVSITEQLTGEAARITERFVYAGHTAEEKALNLAGACVSHYDTAGLTRTEGVALIGVPLSVTRRLLKDADNPDVVADWQGGDTPAWNDLLVGESEGHTSLTTTDATGTVLTTTDARGNMQRVAYDVAGQLSGSWLTLKDGTEQVIVASLTYSAAGQKLREEHGNGIVTTYTYEAETQRLTGIKTARQAGHASGARVLQDLRYKYDPVGNVLKITNDAEETRFWRNQKVVPENTYVYDSLYQLVSATGREMANAGQQSSRLPSATVPIPADDAAYTNYTRTYTYDEAGNMTQIRHSAPATGNSYTTDITVSRCSNRGVLSTLTKKPDDVDAFFTAGGQQKQLQPGQGLVWTPRNELQTVAPVVRDGGTDDSENYCYDAGRQRVLKMSVQETKTSTQKQQVLYLPGLELRSTQSGNKETESLEVITVEEAGRAQVRVLHWTSGRPAEITGDQIRYSYDNLTGSSGLELDGDGNIISAEEYYPYGGTAVWTARNAVEADYKTLRYSGKERDATGLYYYGYRYYQPWAGRWLSTDPAGTIDGINLFRMVRNNPVTLRDNDGLSPESIARRWLEISRKKRADNSFLRMQNNGSLLRDGFLSEAASMPGFSGVAFYLTSSLLFKFPNAFGSERDIKGQALQNQNSLRASEFNTQEVDFIKNFIKEDFYLAHATNANIESENGNINFYSRKMLQDKKIIFNESNSDLDDVYGLGNDDYAFFSLEIGPALKKQKSRFGNTVYKVSASNGAFKFASLSLVDQLTMELPEPKIPRLSSEGSVQLAGRPSLKREEVFFHGLDDSILSLARHIALSTRVLSKQSDRDVILNERNPDKLDRITNYLFRPEVRVPRMAGIKNGGYFKYRFGNR
jgi:insecticidal toxin complex protein TccC